jgi:alcohol dehydrogenase (cytochrome c)
MFNIPQVLSRCIPALLVGLVAVSATPLSRAAEDTTPATGTFTEEQYQRGELLYAEQCALCHGDNLEGGVAPTLLGPTFRKTWSRINANVGELYNRIATTMPPAQAGRLGDAQNLDILSFVLGRNNVLVGTEELQADYNYLSVIPLGRGDEVLDISANFIEGFNGIEPTGSGPSFDQLKAAASNPRDWLYHNHNYQGTRYSGLAQINTGNATEVAQVCAYQMNSRAAMQNGPIVYDGVMYITNTTHTAAINAATCEKLWAYDWQPRDRMVWGNNRGVAIKDGYVVRGTNDGYLFALDSANGELLWARQVADPWLGETFTMAPMIFEDMILIGPAGSENAISGWVGAFSLANGDQIWKFMTVPGATLQGGPTWGNPQGIPLGGGAVWTPLSMDLELEELYVAVTNPAPDFPAYLRPGENLYTNSIVALNVRDGALNWYKSIVPNDDHDWDLTQVSPVLKAGLNNVTRDLVATVGKDGVLRTLDKQTREALYEVPVTTLENVDVPVTPEGVHACPGLNGGVLWSGPAYHPGENILITPAIDYCDTFIAAPTDEVRFVPGQLYMGGAWERDSEWSGWVTAVDVESGEVRWKYHAPMPMLAAVTTTAGNLVITGGLDGNLLLMDAASGEILKAIWTGAPIGGGIVSYEVEGRQYIAINSGEASGFFPTGIEPRRDGSVIVYALPESGAD